LKIFKQHITCGATQPLTEMSTKELPWG